MSESILRIGAMAVVLACLGCTVGKAQNSITDYFEANSPIHKRIYRFTANPAAYALLPLRRDVRIETRYLSEKSDDAVLHSVFDGNAMQRWALRAEGYNTTDSSGVIVGGMAEYAGQIRRSTAWSNVADTELFYPYLVADSIGGDYFSETYRIGGFYGRRWKRLLLSGKFDYRGAIAYRKSDPRPKNDVSEMKFTTGALYPFGNYTVGGYLGYRSYRQKMANSVLKPDRKERFFSMKGFALFNYDLSEIGNYYTCYFQMNEWKTGFHISRNDNRAWAAMAAISRQYADEKDEKERTPYRITRSKIVADVSYQWRPTPKHILQLGAATRLQNASGTENHYDTVMVHRDPDIIAYEKSYSARKHILSHWQASATALYQYHPTTTLRLWTTLSGAWNSYAERYIYPEYALQANRLMASVEIGVGRQFRERSWTAVSLHARRVAPQYAYMHSPPENGVVSKMLYPQYNYLKAGYTQAGATIEYNVSISRLMLFGVSAFAQLSVANAGRYDLGTVISLRF